MRVPALDLEDGAVLVRGGGLAIEDAKDLAAEAVARQRRAVAQATTAEKALFARGELQVLAEAVAGKVAPKGQHSCAWRVQCSLALLRGFAEFHCVLAGQPNVAKTAMLSCHQRQMLPVGGY